VYLGQTFWPAHLAVFYPWRALSGSEILGAAMLVLGITLFVFWLRQSAALVG